MKVFAIGGGSMGWRRLRDLTYLAPGEVSLFEPVEQRCKEITAAFGIRGFTDFEAAWTSRPSLFSPMVASLRSSAMEARSCTRASARTVGLLGRHPKPRSLPTIRPRHSPKTIVALGQSLRSLLIPTAPRFLPPPRYADH